jgi:hypothetical protein
MTPENIGIVCSVLAQMPGIPTWNAQTEAGLVNFYAIAVKNIPDSDVEALCQAIVMTACDDQGRQWRPSPPQIIDMWRKLTADDSEVNATYVLGELRTLAAKYGTHGAVHPSHPHRWPYIAAAGAPPEVAKMPRCVALTIEAFGGWCSFAQQFDWSDGTDRAQFIKLLNAATESSSDITLKAIRAEHKQANAQIEADGSAAMERMSGFQSDTSEPFDADQARTILRKIGSREVVKQL